MRFDDRMQTVLRGARPQGAAAAIQWRQVADLLAQRPGKLVSDDVQSGLTRLRDLHDLVPEQERVEGVQALRGRLRSAPLLVYLASDTEPVRDAAMNAADFSAAEWADLQEQLPAQFGVSDEPAADPDNLVEDQPADPDNREASEEPSQISALVDRIARYQKDRAVERGENALVPAPAEPEAARSFAFSTDEQGVVTACSDVPPGSVVGVTIAHAAYDDAPGPDAYGAAAFRQRMPMENARMQLCGAPQIEGTWRISARPVFTPRTGRFEGYRGIMRRPHAAEDATHDGEVTAGDPAAETSRREQLQQVIHELRTPLNAIIGFSEIIEQQLFGPVAFEYRGLAHSIQDEAKRLLTGFEDLALAARVDAGDLDRQPGHTAPEWLLQRMADRLQGLSEAKRVDLRIRSAEPVRQFAADPDTVERIFARLLSAGVVTCEAGEELTASLATRIGVAPVNQFTLSRPRRTVGIDADTLLDPSHGIEGDADDAPLLGLGFSLRLVGNLAQAIGGSLRLEPESFVLTLPATATGAAVRGERE